MVIRRNSLRATTNCMQACITYFNWILTVWHTDEPAVHRLQLGLRDGDLPLEVGLGVGGDHLGHLGRAVLHHAIVERVIWNKNIGDLLTLSCMGDITNP